MIEYIPIIGLIVIAILVIHELVRFKLVSQFNIINLVYHLAASSAVLVGGYTSAPTIVRVILILLGLIGLGFGFHLQERPKKTKPEVES